MADQEYQECLSEVIRQPFILQQEFHIKQIPRVLAGEPPTG